MTQDKYAGYCIEGEKHCVCGGDLPSIRAGCSNWKLTSAQAEQQGDGGANDASIDACVLMIRVICLTKPREQWCDAIKRRIEYMLTRIKQPSARAALSEDQCMVLFQECAGDPVAYARAILAAHAAQTGESKC